MKIIVIGGGASGMMASCLAAQLGASVTLIEKGKQLGRKLMLTGNGRCNLTNNCTAAQVVDNTPTGGRFLFSSLNAFPPADVISFFESLGVPLKTEQNNQVFPKSDKASDIVKALHKCLSDTGVTVINSKAKSICENNGSVARVLTTDGELNCDAVILATGGLSFPKTGSTGDGYRMARELGHTITELRGSLVPLVIAGDICKKLQGITLSNVRLSVYDKTARKTYDDTGSLLFAHFGITGPLALTASAHLSDYYNNKYYAHIDFFPGLDEKKLDILLTEKLQNNSNRDVLNALDGLLPKSCMSAITETAGISLDKKAHSISRTERQRIFKLLKSLRLNIIKPRPIEEAVITSGGIDLSEINPKTMESKLVKGLYFAGEIINADAYTGGFNLQIAWSTAHAAAKAIVG